MSPQRTISTNIYISLITDISSLIMINAASYDEKHLRRYFRLYSLEGGGEGGDLTESNVPDNAQLRVYLRTDFSFDEST